MITAGSPSPSPEPLSRREALGGLGALLAAGLWPGALRAGEPATSAPAPGGNVGSLRFVVANDLHHDSPACDAWFERLFRQIAAHEGLAFCALLGDLANTGQPASLAAVRRLSALAGVPVYAVPGNHDNDVEETTRLYAEAFPGQLNHTWEHAGWRFLALDTTDGKKWGDTRVSAGTLAWLDAELPKLDPRRPLVVFTHFPLGAGVKYRPLNAEALLARFVGFNLRGVFSGHFHSRTLVTSGDCPLVTNVCVARAVGNHDGTVQKGYWLCEATAAGGLAREFVPFDGAAG